VETESPEGAWLMKQVVRRGGHQTFWVWFTDSATRDLRLSVDEKMKRLGCLLEWYSSQLLAVDADSEDRARAIKEALLDEERQGLLECVSSRTQSS
jgi:hypothetical protein